MTRDDPNTVEHLLEPPYDLERGTALNERAGEHDPAFKRDMDDGRAEAAKTKRG
jgi:hypothetical protein